MDIRLCLVLSCISLVRGYEDVTIWEYISSSPTLTTLAGLMQSTDLVEVLSHTGPYTVFAPDNDAFTKLGDNAMDVYSETQIRSILQFHVVEGYILVPMVSAATEYTSLLNEPITVQPNGQTILINGESTVRAATSDVIVNNGVIQITSDVMFPQQNFLTARTIAQIILQDDTKFKNLFLAFMMAGMINLLEGSEFTVFAPTDDAFNDFFDHLLDLNNPDGRDIFQKVLKYHIVPGGRSLDTLRNSNQMFTMYGAQITITSSESGVSVDDANIVEADIFASNGYIHAIDKILTPEDLRDLI